MSYQGFATLLLGLAGFSSAALAAPGVALTLDVDTTKVLDDQKNPCVINAVTTAHVTLLHLDGARAAIQKEVDRFLRDVTSHLPAMIHKALKDNNVFSNQVALVNATYDANLFGHVRAYVPGPVSAKVLMSLNEQVNQFLLGTWQPPKDEAKEHCSAYHLVVSATTTPGHYTPHMSVKGPSVYANGNPVGSLTADLKQVFTARYHP
jgi:hypothetical protein